VREHQRPLGRGVVHISQLVQPLLGRERVDVLHVGVHDQHGAGLPAEVDGVHDDERPRALQQLVHEMDAPDTDVEHPHAVGRARGFQPLRDGDAEPVVAAQDIADAGHDHVHVEQDTAVQAAPGAIAALEDQVRRYPPERYPVQHATAQFHLGVALANAGHAEEAAEALRAAVLLFDPDRLPVEHAKALNALGAALRGAERLDEAAGALRAAVEMFASRGQTVEAGAAVFNLGLVQRERGEPEAAATSFTRASEALGEHRGPALRELGTTLLEQGDASAAIPPLENAVALAADAGDEPARGSAANALGLAYLSAGRPADAVDAFRDAVAAHPRTIRPRDHAMAKANLALAYEQAGNMRRARLAARQTLAVPDAPEPVLGQAGAVLDRLGPVTDDLIVVITAEASEQWAAILRDEIPHWRREDADAWVDADLSPDLLEAWLGALLELPPDEMEAAIATTLDALADRAETQRKRFESAVRAALPRFHQPQMLRLEAAFGWSSPAT
jgi:tetratricopeptide (TPR) repeat protein